MEFKLHDKDSAPEASKPVLEKAEKKYGFALNLFGVMAESPAALKAYTTLSGILDEDAGLDAQEQQIVMLATSEFNGCDYCMAAHSTVAEKMAKVPSEIVEALRDDREPDDDKVKALVRFTKALLEHRGWVPEDEQSAFLDASYDRRAVLDVITILALKTLSNYTNHLADTPLDEAFQEKAWSKDA
ncbi:MAG: carboxymuconolactone decarboxylase family protein [Opitutales bacterium]